MLSAFLIDQEVPEYDMDSEDELWVKDQSKKVEITPDKVDIIYAKFAAN
jgi:hypothetical protein